MQKITNFLLSFIVANIICVVPVIVSAAPNLNQVSNADDRYIYLGVDSGFSFPVIKSFIHKETKTKIALNPSYAYGARVGYSFYPNMMIELSANHNPKRKTSYILAEKDLVNGITIPKTKGSTKFALDAYAVNLRFNLNKQFANIAPYITFGGGVARISISPTSSSFKPIPSASPMEFFKVRKNTINCTMLQFGLGLSKNISDNILIELGTKLQLVKDVKIKYDTFDNKTGKFVAQTPIKQTIGVGEVTLGVVFKLPM